MRLFANLFKSKSQRAFKRLQKESPASGDQHSPVSVDFILIDADEEEEEAYAETCTYTTSSKDCSLFYTENPASNIPLTLRSDTPLIAICASSNFLDLRATYPSLPLPMGVSNGAELCIGASFEGYLATLLVPCLWLVLGSYVFVATIFYIFRKCEKCGTGLEPATNDVGVKITQEIPVPACDTFISGPALPTPEEVLDHTLKEYGHLSDSEQEDASFWYPPPPGRKRKPIIHEHKPLKVTIRKDVDVMFRGTVPDSWVAKETNPQETHSASWAYSAHTTAMNIIEGSTPVVRIPTHIPASYSAPVQLSGILKPVLPHSIEVGVRIRSGALLRVAPKYRPAPITTDTRHIALMQHRCFSSSPLKYNYTNSSPHSSVPQTPVLKSPSMPATGLKKSA
ncbi:hypothetical protein B0J17DRAFT_764002 [Rhizoctonia solani]|nr:hypothetical protein B0J17DRAFT_764002 [Rhizoctonia solani]